MAKPKGDNGGVNQSAAIRDILTQNPHAPTTEVIALLSEKGIKVRPSLVYFIKGKMKQQKRKEIGNSMAEAGMVSPVDLILSVRKLANEAGGMAKLKQLVDALAE